MRYALNVTTPVLAVVFFLAGGAGGLVMVAVLAVVHGGVVGTRPLWDEEYRLDKPYGWGLFHSVLNWYGLAGLMSTIGFFIILDGYRDYFPEGFTPTQWAVVASVAVVAVVILPNAVSKRIAVGLAVGLVVVPALVIWIFLVLPAMATIPGLLVCMVTVAVSRRRARRDTADARVEVADATNLP